MRFDPKGFLGIANEDIQALVLAFISSMMSFVGAIFVFFLTRRDRGIIACCFGIGAGVMIYVAFIELLRESRNAFLHNFRQSMAALFCTAFFFLGIVFVAIIRGLTRFLKQCDDHDHNELPQVPKRNEIAKDIENASDMGTCAHHGVVESSDPDPPPMKIPLSIKLLTLAGALHNIPEGISLFFIAVKDPAMGVPIALAMAVHNVPEGLMAALPFYFHSGSRRRTMLWMLAFSMIEFVGAVIAWSIPHMKVSYNFEGAVSALTAGMMVNVGFSEVLVKAREYDPNDRIASLALFFGMAFMAACLNILEYVREPPSG